MDNEIYNPRRLYRLFRPRQASRGSAHTGVPVNLATIGLFNNSTGRSVLVVRDISASGTAGDTIYASYARGQVGTNAGLSSSMVANEAVQPGSVNWIDTATVYPGDYTLSLTAQGAFWWQHDYPFAVVEPGYTLVFQDSAAAHAIAVALIWEAIEIDQLDFYY